MIHLLEEQTYTSVRIERETNSIIAEGGSQALKSFQSSLDSLFKETRKFTIALPVMERLLRDGGKRILELSQKIHGYVHVDTEKFALCLYGFPNDSERDEVEKLWEK